MLPDATLDAVFHALADPTRRAMLARLSVGPATVSELALPFSMSLSAVTQHVKLLEGSGLVTTVKQGRVRTVELSPETLARTEQWLRAHRAHWERRLDRLGALLSESDPLHDDDTPPTKARKP